MEWWTAASKYSTTPLHLGLPISFREAVEPGVLLVESDLHDAGRTVALLRDDQLGHVHVLIPMRLAALVRAARGLAVHLVPNHVVVTLSIDENDHVGVRFDRAGFPQIGKHRPLVLSLLYRT